MINSEKHLDAPHKIHECTFRFDKIFRTHKGRIGGIGKVELPEGRQENIYLHINTKHPICLKDNLTYRLSGKLMPLRPPFNVTNNFSFYLWSRGVRHHASYAKLSVDPYASPTFLQEQRELFYKTLNLKNKTYTNVYRAILMGKKETLESHQLQHFFYTGTMHLFAVSGLHVGVVSTFLFFICKLLRFPKILRIILSGTGVFFYASIVGFSPSTLRASLMVFFILCAQLLSRPIDIQGAFFNTIGTTLFFNPFELWDVGFQLSYGVVASILYLGIPLTAYINKNIDRYYKLKTSCIISLSASVVSSLFSIYYWNLFTPWAFIANLFLIPLASFIVILGITTWFCATFIQILQPLINTIASHCIAILLMSVEYLEKLPFACFTLTIPFTVFITLLFFFSLFIAKPSCIKHMKFLGQKIYR